MRYNTRKQYKYKQTMYTYHNIHAGIMITMVAINPIIGDAAGFKLTPAEPPILSSYDATTILAININIPDIAAIKIFFQKRCIFSS